uniref:Uncharacterized protein n=1 Tax=Biomphalaria glabrata TaxID=6526 RepID=A0A2C9L5K2_BIOGL
MSALHFAIMDKQKSIEKYNKLDRGKLSKVFDKPPKTVEKKNQDKSQKKKPSSKKTNKFTQHLYIQGSKICLELNNKGFREIPEGVFEFPDLNCLFLVNNDIDRLPDSFIYLANLEALVLTGNNIHVINRHIFELPKLQVSNLLSILMVSFQ